MSSLGTMKTKKGRISNVIVDTTTTGTITCTGVSIHGAAMCNAPRPCCYIRDTTAVTLNFVLLCLTMVGCGQVLLPLL